MKRTIFVALVASIAVTVALSFSGCSGCRRSGGTTETTAAGGAPASATGSTGAAREPAGPPLEVKTYNRVGSAKNQAVEFSIPSFTVTGTVGSSTAPAGKVYLVIDTVWKNVIPLTKVSKHPEQQDATMGAGGLGSGGGQAQKNENPEDYVMKPTPYLVPDVKNHAFVVINGGDTAVVSDAQSGAPHALPVEQIVVPELNAEVKGQLVYEIPASGVSTVLFRFLDTSMGSFDVPLYGKPPAAPTAIAGPVKNDLLEVSAYGVQELASVAGQSAPGSDKYAVVQLGCTGKAQGSLVRVEMENYSYLRDAQGSTYTPAKDVSAPGQFKGMVQLLPETAQRGALVFEVPAQHSALTLVLNLPGYAPLELNLPNTATGGGGGVAVSPPAVLFTISDGETLDVQIHGVRTAPNLGEAKPEEGKRFVVLDLSLVNKVDQGIEFQTGEQLKLLNGEEEILVDSAAMEKLARPLSENSVVPAHGRGRFEVAFQVPGVAKNLVLYYRGFNREEKHPLAM